MSLETLVKPANHANGTNAKQLATVTSLNRLVAVSPRGGGEGVP